MMFDLTAKTALVTGATGAIGGAIARALHGQGATVALSGTRREALEALAGELNERVHVLPCDLTDMDAIEALVPSAEEAMQKLDILVANAGVNRDNLFVQLRDEDWDKVIAVNLTATFRLTRAAVKTMMRRRFGRIIGISSVAGDRGRQSNYLYGAAKGALSLYLQGLRNRLYPKGVRVITVKPGFVDTAMTYGLPGLFLVASPRYVGERIVRALDESADVVYLPWFWRYIMLVIKHIPEKIFKRMKL